MREQKIPSNHGDLIGRQFNDEYVDCALLLGIMRTYMYVRDGFSISRIHVFVPVEVRIIYWGTYYGGTWLIGPNIVSKMVKYTSFCVYHRLGPINYGCP